MNKIIQNQIRMKRCDVCGQETEPLMLQTVEFGSEFEYCPLCVIRHYSLEALN